MSDWQPPSNDTWYNATDIKEVSQLLSLTNMDLLNKTEWLLAPKSSGDSIDDIGDYIERLIRKWLRSRSGGDLSEFTIINPHIRTEKEKTDLYLDEIFHIVCNDQTIHDYLRQLIELPPTEQVLRIAVFLDKHPKMKKSRYSRRGATYAIATVLFQIGLENFSTCEKS